MDSASLIWNKRGNMRKLIRRRPRTLNRKQYDHTTIDLSIQTAVLPNEYVLVYAQPLNPIQPNQVSHCIPCTPSPYSLISLSVFHVR